MTCAELADVAAELALGVLTGRERAMAVAHLDTCDECREDVRELIETGEQLLELLPPVEPPAGFETRVLARLGLPASPPESPQDSPQPYPVLLRPGTGAGPGSRHRRPAHGDARPGSDRPGDGHPGNPRPKRATRLRRALAAAAVGLAIVAAGLGGWRIGAGTAPAVSQESGALSTASLVSANRQSVGTIFIYSGTPRWLYMAVDLGGGDEIVTCQLVGANGQIHTLGSFRLANGYGAWGNPAPPSDLHVSGARLVSASGTILATATIAT
jgi:hypothetical protein